MEQKLRKKACVIFSILLITLTFQFKIYKNDILPSTDIIQLTEVINCVVYS